jgi:dGTPase
MILGILHLATLVKSDGEYSIGNGKKYKDQLTAKEWQDLIDFEGNANGFTVLTGSRPGIEGGLRISLLLWEHL